jgi:hypothetical protein
MYYRTLANHDLQTTKSPPGRITYDQRSVRALLRHTVAKQRGREAYPWP